jgi:hypothetical protein
MRNPGGYAIITHPEQRTIEYETITCKHCNSIVKIPPRVDAASIGGRCGVCDGLICPRCLGKGCRPFEEALKRAEARDAARRSYGL